MRSHAVECPTCKTIIVLTQNPKKHKVWNISHVAKPAEEEASKQEEKK